MKFLTDVWVNIEIGTNECLRDYLKIYKWANEVSLTFRAIIFNTIKKVEDLETGILKIIEVLK